MARPKSCTVGQLIRHLQIIVKSGEVDRNTQIYLSADPEGNMYASISTRVKDVFQSFTNDPKDGLILMPYEEFMPEYEDLSMYSEEELLEKIRKGEKR